MAFSQYLILSLADNVKRNCLAAGNFDIDGCWFGVETVSFDEDERQNTIVTGRHGVWPFLEFVLLRTVRFSHIGLKPIIVESL